MSNFAAACVHLQCTDSAGTYLIFGDADKVLLTMHLASYVFLLRRAKDERHDAHLHVHGLQYINVKDKFGRLRVSGPD